MKHESTNEPVACFVETEQGVMVWPIDDINEAGTYCEENEFPVLLYTHQQDQKKDEALRLAQAFICWTQFGECRTERHDGPIPTAAEVDAAIEQALENK